MFELWNTRTRNAIGSYETREIALEVARDLIARGYAPADLLLAQVNNSGGSHLVASGDDLMTATTQPAATSR
jgi:uncharacterized protein YciU (UPF0263 family)